MGRLTGLEPATTRTTTEGSTTELQPPQFLRTYISVISSFLSSEKTRFFSTFLHGRVLLHMLKPFPFQNIWFASDAWVRRVNFSREFPSNVIY